MFQWDVILVNQYDAFLLVYFGKGILKGMQGWLNHSPSSHAVREYTCILPSHLDALILPLSALHAWHIFLTMSPSGKAIAFLISPLLS